jgi:hypothetical protein
MGVLKEDFQKIKRLIDSDGQIPDLEEGDSNLESGTLVDKQEKGEQLGLF